MSQHKKTIELLKRMNRNISFEQAESLLKYLGFLPTKKGSSHVKFVHKDCRKSITLVRNTRLKGYLIEEMLEILEFFGVEDDV